MDRTSAPHSIVTDEWSRSFEPPPPPHLWGFYCPHIPPQVTVCRPRKDRVAATLRNPHRCRVDHPIARVLTGAGAEAGDNHALLRGPDQLSLCESLRTAAHVWSTLPHAPLPAPAALARAPTPCREVRGAPDVSGPTQDPCCASGIVASPRRVGCAVVSWWDRRTSGTEHS